MSCVLCFGTDSVLLHWAVMSTGEGSGFLLWGSTFRVLYTVDFEYRLGRCVQVCTGTDGRGIKTLKLFQLQSPLL